MTSALLITQIILAVVITILVLLQKSSSIGLGAYSGSNESLFGAKGPANFLSKFTMIIGALFLANTLTLGYFYNQERLKSAVDSVTNSPVPQAPAVAPLSTDKPAPQAPTIPVVK